MAGKDWSPAQDPGLDPPPGLCTEGAQARSGRFDHSGQHVESRDTALALARKEGIFCGLSAGGTVAAALKLAETAPKGSAILAMLPDTGERYLSTFLFEGINEGSDDDWLGSL